MDVGKYSASGSVSDTMMFTQGMKYGRSSCSDFLNRFRYISNALMICCGAKWLANAYGNPSSAAKYALSVLDPKIQIGTFVPSPGKARTALVLFPSDND